MTIEVMKQALEALEETANGCICRNCIKQVKAITSLRQAIEQAEKQEPVECQYGNGGYACCEGGPCKADEQNNAAPVQGPIKITAFPAVKGGGEGGVCGPVGGTAKGMKMQLLCDCTDASQCDPYGKKRACRKMLKGGFKPAPQQADHIVDANKMVQEPDYQVCATCGGMATDPIVPLEQRAKREWVGLTDEDWDEIFGNSLTIGAAIKNTEAKLKEKNNG